MINQAWQCPFNDQAKTIRKNKTQHRNFEWKWKTSTNKFVFFTAPRAAPKNVTMVKKTSTSLFIKWDAIPEKNQRYGNILGYLVNYTLLPRDVRKVHIKLICAAMVDVNLTGLRKFRNYHITVSAFNRHGVGPPSRVLVVRTEEGSKLWCGLFFILKPDISTLKSLNKRKDTWHFLVVSYQRIGNHDSERGESRAGTVAPVSCKHQLHTMLDA